MTDKICLNQLFRPSVHIEKEGVGNCTTCKANEDNKNCKGYYEVKVKILDVN